MEEIIKSWWITSKYLSEYSNVEDLIYDVEVLDIKLNEVELIELLNLLEFYARELREISYKKKIDLVELRKDLKKLLKHSTYFIDKYEFFLEENYPISIVDDEDYKSILNNFNLDGITSYEVEHIVSNSYSWDYLNIILANIRDHLDKDIKDKNISYKNLKKSKKKCLQALYVDLLFIFNNKKKSLDLIFNIFNQVLYLEKKDDTGSKNLLDIIIDSKSNINNIFLYNKTMNVVLNKSYNISNYNYCFSNHLITDKDLLIYNSDLEKKLYKNFKYMIDDIYKTSKDEVLNINNFKYTELELKYLVAIFNANIFLSIKYPFISDINNTDFTLLSNYLFYNKCRIFSEVDSFKSLPFNKRKFFIFSMFSICSRTYFFNKDYSRKLFNITIE